LELKKESNGESPDDGAFPPPVWERSHTDEFELSVVIEFLTLFGSGCAG